MRRRVHSGFRRVADAPVVLTVGLVAALLLAGCGKEEESDKPTGYVETIMGAKEVSERIACRARMRSLTLALTAYAAENEGQFPPSLDTLVESGAASKELLRCPSRSGPAYEYIAGQDRNMPGGNVLVLEAEAAHGGRFNVVRLDGTAESLSPEQLAAARAKTQAAIRAAGGE